MNKAIELIPLSCIHCNYPIPAEDQQVAWVCAQCGTGMELVDTGLEPLKIFHFEGIQAGQTGRPYWVVNIQVSMDRKSYNTFGKKNKDAEEFWSGPRLFFLPAFDCSVEELVEIGKAYLRNPIALAEGEPVTFLPITMGREDLPAIAEYLVMAIEAERRDDVKQVLFKLTLSEPVLWILP